MTNKVPQSGQTPHIQDLQLLETIGQEVLHTSRRKVLIKSNKEKLSKDLKWLEK